MLEKVYKWIKENLFLIFFILIFVFYGTGLVNANSLKGLEPFITTLFTLIAVFLGFVIFKDVMFKWRKKYEGIRQKSMSEINQSVKDEVKESDINKKIELCESRTQKYRNLLSLSPNEYTYTLFFSFIFLLSSKLSFIFLGGNVIWPALNAKGSDLAFILFWMGLYFLIKHIILFMSIVSQEE